jgi:hypothetical protein
MDNPVPELSAEPLEKFLESRHRPKLGGVWRFLKVDEDCRHLTPAVVPLLNKLREQFGEEQLLASRLFVRDQAHGVVPNPRLDTEDGVALVLRDAKGRPCDLLTSAGAISGRLPLFALLDDVRWTQALDHVHRVFVVFSMADAAVLRALGFAAVPAFGLDRLNRSGLQQLLTLVGGWSNDPPL